MNEIERPLIDTDLLRTFLAIAACGNLTAAADRLGRTQSATSVQLRKLEDSLGAVLFDREPRGMVLTVQGETLLPKARELVADIRRTARLFSDPLTGSIRIGLPDDFSVDVLERILTDFSDAHPEVKVIAAFGCTAGYPEAVRAGRLDTAVFSAPGNTEGEPLGEEPTVWAAKSAREPCLDGNRPVPLALLERSCWWRDLPVRALQEAGRAHEVVFKSSSFASLQAAVRAGVAVSILPVSALDGGVTVLTEADGFPPLPSSRRSLLVSRTAPAQLAQAMSGAIRSAWRAQATGRL